MLSFAVTEMLFLENKNKEEGFLSQKRAIIIGRKHLNLVGKKIIPENKIRSKLTKIPDNIYGNILEAIIGAIYLDKGIDQAKKFIKKRVYNSVFLEELTGIDYKSKLLKHSQKEKIKISYTIEEQNGPDHNKEFLVAVLLGDKKIAEAKGSSKKEAEQKAAKKAIKIVF